MHVLQLRCLRMKENNRRGSDRFVRLLEDLRDKEIIWTDKENVHDFLYHEPVVFFWNDCGLSHETPDQLSMVYSLTKHSTLQMLLHRVEYPIIYFIAVLMARS